MFDPSPGPRVFHVPLGVDFPRALVGGLLDKHRDLPPDALARVTLIVNTRRMARRIRALFDDGPPLLLPQIALLTDLGEGWNLQDIPDPVSPLRRRLELTQLVSALLDQQPDSAARSLLYDLSDSLAQLMDEMHGEGVKPDSIEALDITDQSGHWERVKSFLGIVRHYFDADHDAPDVETRQRLVIENLVREWAATPPAHPIIVAGSTGSRGATQLLMQAVARLPQGTVVLPGFDTEIPADVWDILQDPLTSEDHPQYRFAQFLQQVGLTPGALQAWTPTTPANPARNKLMSLALRPAPVTDQWLRDGPKLGDIAGAVQDVTLLQAPSARIEALTIAMRLRQAAEDGETGALITPDRTLTRQVTAALDQWGIRPDDSAGIPLHLSAPGRFLRHVADLFRDRLSCETLLTLLKHPLTHSGSDRGPHLRLTRELELHLRRNGPPYPEVADIARWAAGVKLDGATDWAGWICDHIVGTHVTGPLPLDRHVTTHIALAEAISRGPDPLATGILWQGEDGRKAHETVSDLAENALFGGALDAMDYISLFHAVLSRQEVRSPDDTHPGILIWGTLEARVQGADLIILAGLNEGVWPQSPNPDPWLNRILRHRAGLLLPERRIGLSAHDFQQAALAPRVWLTRSTRSDDAQTVPSRWLNRLQNLMTGLEAQGGKTAFEGMMARGQTWLNLATALETPPETDAEKRPSPRPPVTARPKQLSVTEIKRLIRDPYAIYARHVLGLRPLDPLMQAPDALLRGIVLHEVLEQFIKATVDDPSQIVPARLMAETETILAQNVPWAEARALWLARMGRVATWFTDTEITRRAAAMPAAFEATSRATLPALDFTLTAKADRIDITPSGQLHIYDYKTGAPPTGPQQANFDKQLLLESAMAQISGFGDLVPAQVAHAKYISLSGAGKETEAPLADEPPAKVWADFEKLIAAYMMPDRGYTARRALHKSTDPGDYDQLARFGEWDSGDNPDPQEVG